jgi:hypothetical protein
MMNRVLVHFLGAAVLLGAVSAAVAAEVALVAGVNGSPKLTRDGQAQVLARGAPAQLGDIVESDAASKVKRQPDRKQ